MTPEELRELRDNAHELAVAYENPASTKDDIRQIESKIEEAKASSADWKLMRAVYEKESKDEQTENMNARRIARYFAERLDFEAQQKAAKRQLIISGVGWTISIVSIFVALAKLVF